MDVGAKRKALVLSVGGDCHEREKEKLCLVYECAPDYGEDEYHIYLIDLDGSDAEENFIFKAPTLRIGRKCMLPDGFCLLGSKLYLICFSSRGRNSESSKCVYTYEFPPDISEISDKELEMADVRRITEMHDTKYNGIVVPTPDRKNILVFSSSFHGCERADVPVDRCHFEIYDSCRREWYRLPPMPADWRSRTFRIQAHFFINDHTIMLQTDNVGDLVLDFSSHNGPGPAQRWHRSDVPLNVPATLSGYTIFVEDDLYLTSHQAYHMTKAYNKTTAFAYPYRSSLMPYGRLLWTDSITLVDADARNGVWKFCIARTEVDSGGWCPHLMTDDRTATCPHLLVNVYGFNLEEYRKELGQMKEQGGLLPGVTVHKSFKFYLRNTEFPDYIRPACVLPFKQKNESNWT